jgi:lipid II:glycine glycyltransferase (peptidoglycan interpeptide bridge formation enzyme)
MTQVTGNQTMKITEEDRMQVVDFDLRSPQAGTYLKFLESRGEGAFQTPQWALAKASEGWRPWGLLLLMEGEIQAGLIALERPILVAPRPLGALWHVPRGPVASLESTQGRLAASRLLLALEARARARGGLAIRISPDVRRECSSGDWLAPLGYVPAPGEPWQHTATFRVSLLANEQEMLARMKGLKRRAIRKAHAQGIRVDSSNSAGSFDLFYDMYRATGTRNNFRVIREGRMRSLWKCSKDDGWGGVFISRTAAGEPLSAMMAIAPGRRCHYLFGASTPLCRKLHGNELLHWEVMRWAQARGCAIYDLEGVPGRVSSDHPLYGNYLFKSGFGGEYVELAGEYVRVLRPRLYELIERGIKRLRR